MPLAAENFVQENSGTVTTAGTSCVVSLPSGTIAGNTLFVFLTALVGVTAPAGFTQDHVLDVNLYAYRKSEVAADETSWTFTTASNSTFAWYVAEVSGVSPVEPLDATASHAFTGTFDNATFSSGTSTLNASLNTVVFAAFAAQQTGGSTESWSGYTNDFEELVDISPGGYELAVARKFVAGTTGTFETTATLDTSQASTSTGALVVVYRSADSPIAAPLQMLAGFEWGTHGGINSHIGSTSLTGAALTAGGGTWGTSYLIQAGSARNSGYGLQVVQSGAAGYVQVGSVTGAGFSFGFDVRVVSATGTVVVVAFANRFQLLYDATNSQFGVRAGTTGTVSWQSGTTATNTWVWVDLRVKCNTATWRVEWRLETAADTYTEQAAAELGGQTPGVVNNQALVLGHTAAQTMTADYDNAVLSTYYVAYPLGPHQIRLLTVDPAGTPSVSGTSSNFSVFTSNGTLGAWNATNARNAVDEVPPTVSASADGVVQTATATGDYMEFPMDAATVAADEVIAGVRMLAPAWGGTGAGTGTLGIRGFDGTTETTLITASTSYDAGSPTAVSSTEPRWQCAMWQWPTGGWTKTRLDGASLRVGFSTDAAPDMGVDAVYLEYATHKATTGTVIGEAGQVTLAGNVDPNTAGVRSLVTTTPPERGTTLHYTQDGTPTSVVIPADTIDTQVLDAADIAGVTDIGTESEAS